MIPGDGMAETDLVHELGSRWTRLIAFALALAIIGAVVAVYFVIVR